MEEVKEVVDIASSSVILDRSERIQEIIEAWKSAVPHLSDETLEIVKSFYRDSDMGFRKMTAEECELYDI